MKWERGYRSERVDDMRGRGGSGGSLPMGLFIMLFRTFGLRGVIVGAVLLGGLYLFTGGQATSLSREGSATTTAGDDEMASFVSFVFDDVQSTWSRAFAERGQRYEPARMTLFTGKVSSACGFASAAVGPFYCSRDQRVYIDLSFYQALRGELGAPGDFAQAYVIAHEVGHHVQNLTGGLRHSGEEGADAGSVRTELQADCLAGVWAHDTSRRDLLEQGDIAEAMRAAEAIGDDTLQQRSGQAIRPESWTHGSSAQRTAWFERGLETGTVEACDTFERGAL